MQSMQSMTKLEEIEKIEQAVTELTDSPLYEFRKQNNYFPVIGEGSLEASIMFIGEAPGKNEALSGKPFCGASGRILDELLASINIRRSDVYVTSIVKDRPPENRDPTPREIKSYGPFLDQQINIIQPKVIATLGRYAMVYILEKFKLNDQLAPISKLHGKKIIAKTDYGQVIIVPLYHPAVALYNRSSKLTLIEDFKIINQAF
ncbi:MAG: uracil-DNA glycosylase [bacterium]|nr:uracil-DNA glycosylase [bacterium]